MLKVSVCILPARKYCTAVTTGAKCFMFGVQQHIQIAIDNSSLPTADECSTVSRISPSDNLDRPLERSYRCTEVAVID